MAKRLSEGIGRSSLLGDFENDLAAIEQRWTLAEIHNVVHSQGASITDAIVGTVDLDADALAGGIYGAKSRAIASAFRRHFRGALKRKSLLIAIDGYDEIAGKELGEWLLDVLDPLPNTLVLLGRSPVAPKPLVPEERTLAAPLSLFTREEVGKLLKNYLGRPPDQSLIDAVYSWSAGHPGTAAIAAKFLGSVDDPQASSLEERLETASDDVEKAQAQLAVDFVSTLGDPNLAEVAKASAIPRSFDESLLAALMGKEVPEDALDVLEVAGIVERLTDEHGDCARVHRFIREPLLRLSTDSVRKKLHRRAASHYYMTLSEDEPELGTGALPYEGWYRYEQPGWQATLREWLYHQREAARNDSERRRARLQFARIFLDAFWWWGCYVDFPFCKDLVADWERARNDDGAWIHDLRRFLASYPLGWRKENAPGWIDVELALIGIRRECGIAGPADSLRGPDARHTRALIDNFLAHACRYRAWIDETERRQEYERGLRYYQEARRLFERGGERWELAWTLFETAELHTDNREFDAAREMWRQAAAKALRQDDHELTANLFRLSADIHWHDGDETEAFAAHAQAVLHAYLSQSRTPSHRPDVYTVTFYFEQVERVFERLRTRQGTALATAVEKLRAPFTTRVTAETVAALLVAGDGRSLAESLFPAAPREEELLATRSPLTDKIDLLAERLGDDLEERLARLQP